MSRYRLPATRGAPSGGPAIDTGGDTQRWPDIPHAASRWVRAVEAVIDLPHDPKTVLHWCESIGVGNTQLRVSCRAVGVTAKDSLDFARILRALVHRTRNGWSLHELLDVGDPRTLQRLVTKVGLNTSTVDISPADFLETQRIVRSSVVLDELRRVLVKK